MNKNIFLNKTNIKNKNTKPNKETNTENKERKNVKTKYFKKNIFSKIRKNIIIIINIKHKKQMSRNKMK